MAGCLSSGVLQLQVSLRPGLRWPGVTGLRVEVNGQVLSQGGDVAADQLEDTTAETHIRYVKALSQLSKFLLSSWISRAGMLSPAAPMSTLVIRMNLWSS